EAEVHALDVGGEGATSGVERRLVADLHVRDEVLDGRAELLEVLGVAPADAPRAALGGELLALAREHVGADHALELGVAELEIDAAPSLAPTALARLAVAARPTPDDEGAEAVVDHDVARALTDVPSRALLGARRSGLGPRRRRGLDGRAQLVSLAIAHAAELVLHVGADAVEARLGARLLRGALVVAHGVGDGGHGLVLDAVVLVGDEARVGRRLDVG